MRNGSKITKRNDLIRVVEAKQRNVVWPDMLRNSAQVDGFLWKGAPDAPLVQRIGAWIFGVTLMAIGLGLFDVAYHRPSWLFGAASIAVFLIGAKVFWNGFRRRKVDQRNSK
jgi:hypothetical protein